MGSEMCIRDRAYAVGHLAHFRLVLLVAKQLAGHAVASYLLSVDVYRGGQPRLRPDVVAAVAVIVFAVAGMYRSRAFIVL